MKPRGAATAGPTAAGEDTLHAILRIQLRSTRLLGLQDTLRSQQVLVSSHGFDCFFKKRYHMVIALLSIALRPLVP
jgi:hypothetical protein